MCYRFMSASFLTFIPSPSQLHGRRRLLNWARLEQSAKQTNANEGPKLGSLEESVQKKIPEFGRRIAGVLFMEPKLYRSKSQPSNSV